MHLNMKKWEALGSPQLTIYLDDYEVQCCIEAHEEKGYVVVQDIDDVFPGMDDIPQKTMFGSVRIECTLTKTL